ncbi:hypothetical protein F7734_43465 [Scytonema sp. UIC 10036]|uniref:hypothetical protein n=1 Tax=Scytonema sp. UIC 10036 TaxID=2304196 RepID=UPI0012DAB9E8|nr:hypothetical protein [Scytonema sp. UIC 10036]MUG98790.1 hypothetical protein [Scytonema sp. UIC 10036]
MNIEKGDRVITPKGQGEVIEDKVYQGPFSIFFGPQIKVKLDGSGEEKEFSQENLELQAKKPSKKEAIEAVDKIKAQLDKIPNLPKREKGELPNHLEYFKEGIQVNNDLEKQLSVTNLDYVEKTLEAVKKTDSKANCWQEIESNFKIVRWWTRAK